MAASAHSEKYNEWIRSVQLVAVNLVSIEARSAVGALARDAAKMSIDVQSVDIAMNEFPVLTALVSASFRCESADSRPGGVNAPSELLGSIDVTYAAVYTCGDGFDAEGAEPFKRTAVVHVWPILRERIRNITHDFGWTAPMIAPWVVAPPMDVGAPSATEPRVAKRKRATALATR